MPTLQILRNAVVAKIVDAPREVKLRVAEILSYQVQGYEHSDAYKLGHWDGRSSFFIHKKAAFPAGFVIPVAQELKKMGFEVMTRSQKNFEVLGPEITNASQPIDAFPEDPRYEYQFDAMRALERRKMMIAQLATGGGKSRVARLCTARIGRPTLFLTTRKALMWQMKEGYEESGMYPGVMGDGVWKPKRDLNVGMVATIASRLNSDDPEKAAQMKRILQHFEFIIGEEAHESGGNEFFDILTTMKSAEYRLALTATPFMRDDAKANMRLMAAFGPIGIKVSEKELIDKGILATPHFKFMPNSMKDVKRVFRTTGYQRAYKYGITENQERNARIVHEVTRFNEYGLKGMILVRRKDHGNNLEELLTEKGLRTKFIFGETKTEKRQEALDALKAGEIDVLIGSTILDVGVDVPAMSYVVLAGGGKAEVALRQRIGRALRAKKDGPNVCFVIDFEDKGNNHLAGHAKQRRVIIEGTPGFDETILPAKADFDFEGLGFIKALAA